MLPAYFLYHDVTFRKWGFPNLGGGSPETSYSTCMGAALTTVKAATKVVRRRQD